MILFLKFWKIPKEKTWHDQLRHIQSQRQKRDVMNLGEKEDEEVTDEVAYDKKKVVKLVDE